jgi:hypothetical protein
MILRLEELKVFSDCNTHTNQWTLGKFTLMHETTELYDTMKPLKEIEVFTAVNAQITAFWAVMSCSPTAG